MHRGKINTNSTCITSFRISSRLNQSSNKGGKFLKKLWCCVGGSIYILLDVLVCSIAVYFYELCGILTSP